MNAELAENVAPETRSVIGPALTDLKGNGISIQ